MKAITRKLLRDVWALRSQVLTVALVIASAFSGFAGSLATYESLERARDDFYDRAHFAQVFAELKRAPRSLERRLLEIPGVAAVATTVSFDVRLDLAGVDEPVIGRLIGLPDTTDAPLNRLLIRHGRLPEAGTMAEAVVSEGFSTVRKLVPGTALAALINGRQQLLRVSGVGLSPDYIYATQGGAFPDDRNFGVLWMDRKRLASAYDMDGAFNRVALALAPGASETAVQGELDQLLEPYGGTRAYPRADQLSHRILSQEINQWKVMGTIIPSIFLGVAAFLLSVVMSRQVGIQREQIAALKALGYGNGAVAAHYLQQVAIVLVIGIAIGIGVGIWFGRAVTALYAEFFHFPSYQFVLPLWVVLAAAGVSALAAAGGALGAVRRAVRLAPAEAMRPPYPGRFRPALLERIRVLRLSPAVRMTLRNLERKPLRAVLTTLGIAAAMAIIISGMFWRDALDYMIDVQFETAQRGHFEVSLVEARGPAATLELAHVPGVLRLEGSRQAPARLVAGPRTYRTAILGVPAGAELRRAIDRDLTVIRIPAAGVLLTDRLAERLGVAPGDSLAVEMLTGKRARGEVVVAGTVHDLIGLVAYMDLAALDRLAGEGERITSFSLRLDDPKGTGFVRRMKTLPRVAVVASKQVMLENFRGTTARNVLFFTGVLTAFAVVIAIGVVYNNARIVLQERAWELASLRVLGFTRGEVSMYLLGELAIETAVAVPLGGVLGYALAWLIVRMTHTDMIAIPVIVSAGTYAYAAMAILLAAAASALIVRRRIDRLDLIGVLKTRE